MAFEMFPETIMSKYATDPLEFEAYMTKYAKRFFKEKNEFIKVVPKRKEDI